jgi:hypothetical protein
MHPISGWFVLATTAIVSGCAGSGGTGTASPSSPTSSAATTRRTGGAGSNARSGPASGGAAGTVDSVFAWTFTLTTSAGEKVIVNEASSTTYQRGTSPDSVKAITAGERVLVLGTTSGAIITAARVIVQPIGGGGLASASASEVIPFRGGAPAVSKQAGEIPANYSQGSGTIVGGTKANAATEAALAAYPGGIVDRVVQLSNGEYEVHNIGVSWPHHIFVTEDFRVVGAD